jgi:CO/xanthine dehydrogenase Mo-binding subunit
MNSDRRDFLKSTGSLVICFTLPGCSDKTGTAGPGFASIDNRIRIDSTGVVNLALGKVELGQGIGTALAQIAAEELRVNIDRMRLSAVDTDYSPDESYTFSTISVQQSGPLVRKAAAAGRHFLMQRASAELGVPTDDMSVLDGVIFISGAATDLDYWKLIADQEISVEVTGDERYLPVSQYRSVGQSVQRLDIPGKLFGEAIYLQDLRLPDMVHARVVRPPAERARLVDMDSEEVERMPGVLDIIHDGDFVAVVAEREQQARNAATALRNSIRWSRPDDLPGPDNVYEWLRSAPSRVESIISRQSSRQDTSSTTSISAIYRRPYQAHASISPSAAIALYKRSKLTVWSHAQGMYPLRTAIAHTLGLELDQVRCIHKEAAGCFGHNGADDAACDAAAIAMQFRGRPVRLQWERGDEFAWEPLGSAMQIETRAELDESGRISSWDCDIWSCPHTSRPRNADNAGHLIYAQHKSSPLRIPAAASIPQPAGGADRNAVPLYVFDNMRVTKHLVTDVPLRVSALRGLGAYANIFAIESFMDELARTAGQDPLAFRVRHLEDERATAVLQRLSDESAWPDRPAEGSGEGWGLSFARFKNLSSYVGIVFKVDVDSESGEITLKHAIAVCDAGLIINPDGVRAQIEGGIVQSASWTLKEQVRFTESGITSRDWASYPILRFDEVPQIDVHLMPHNNQKALGVGEAAQGPTAAAIANAVFHASGLRLRKIPFTADQILNTAA